MFVLYIRVGGAFFWSAIMEQLMLHMGATSKRKQREAPSVLPRHPKGKLSPSAQQVFDLMADGYWHTPDEIRKAAGRHGYPATEGLRRMRSLRKYYHVEKSRVRNQLWVYRLR